MKSVGGGSPVIPMSSRTGRPRRLPGEVVEGDVDRALDRAVVADRRGHQALGVLEGGPHVVERRRAGRPRSDRQRVEQQRRHGRHRRRRLAVVGVRVALAEPDRPVGAVGLVAQLRDDRRHQAALAVRRPCDDERVPQRRAPASAAGASGSRRPGPARRSPPPRAAPPPPASISRHSPSPPKRTGSATGSPVCAAVAAISSAGLGLVGDRATC